MCRQDRMTGILVSARQDDWDTYLVYIEFAYINSVNVSTGFSPFVLQFAQSSRAPWDLFNSTEPDEMHRGNSDLTSSLGLDIITIITVTRNFTRLVMLCFFPQKN